MASYEHLVSALETTFDFHSARVVAKDAVDAAGLADRTEWSDDDLKLVAASIPSVGKDLRPVLERLGLAEA